MSEFDDLPEEDGDPAPPRTQKSATAFRTISEVADELHIPQHVLRFWETKFPQVKPLKRGGGRRYYRPDDLMLLRRVSELLYIQGYTIKGVQRLLREGGGRLDDVPEAVRVKPDYARMTDAELGMTPEESAASHVFIEVPEESYFEQPAFAQPTEVEQLRAVLRDALAALEAIRAALP